MAMMEICRVPTMGAMKRLQCKKVVCSVEFHSMKCLSIVWSRNSIPCNIKLMLVCIIYLHTWLDINENVAIVIKSIFFYAN